MTHVASSNIQFAHLKARLLSVPSGRAAVGVCVFISAAALLTGCGGDKAMTDKGGGAYSSAAMPMPAAKGDGEFASMMAMHHKGAIEMGRYEAQHGSRNEVRQMAGAMAEAQSAESVKLLAIARESGRGEMGADPMLEKHMTRDMAALRDARGGEVDRVFLTHMIDHHAMGVDMARAAMPNLKRDDTRRMANMMIDDQTREIAKMRGMLN